MSANRQSALDRLNAEERAFLGFTVSPDSHSVAIPTAPKSGPASATSSPPKPTTANLRRGQSLRSVTLRLTPETADALRRAAAERCLEYDEPFTQQSIAEAALCGWLGQRGYLSQ